MLIGKKELIIKEVPTDTTALDNLQASVDYQVQEYQGYELKEVKEMNEMDLNVYTKDRRVINGAIKKVKVLREAHTKPLLSLQKQFIAKEKKITKDLQAIADKFTSVIQGKKKYDIEQAKKLEEKKEQAFEDFMGVENVQESKKDLAVQALDRLTGAEEDKGIIKKYIN